MIRVKNHQIPPTIRVDKALGISSEPGATDGRRRVNNRSNAVFECSRRRMWQKGYIVSRIPSRTPDEFQSQRVKTSFPSICAACL